MRKPENDGLNKLARVFKKDTVAKNQDAKAQFLLFKMQLASMHQNRLTLFSRLPQCLKTAIFSYL